MFAYLKDGAALVSIVSFVAVVALWSDIIRAVA